MTSSPTTPDPARGDARDAGAASAPLPVYVDLDGTLIKSDLLWESLVLLARQRPLDWLRVPSWLARGKAGFKAAIAERVRPSPRTLPYRREVIEYLEAARAEGRPVVLVSASDDRLVESIARELDCIDVAMGSADGRNLAADAKLERIRAHALLEYGRQEFEYLGNAAPDVPIWAAAAVATAVAPTRAARRGLEEIPGAKQTLVAHGSFRRSALRALRPHQWAKNSLLFVPLVLAHELTDVSKMLRVVLGFLAFSAVASSGYLLNDLFDIEADRQHPTKRRRPLASGDLPIPVGLVLIATLLLAAFGVAATSMPRSFAFMLALYLSLTYSYSWYFKEKLLLDVLVLAGLYTHRVLTGGVAAAVEVSPWLLAFSTFFFLSLALVKRYVELIGAQERDRDDLKRRAYQVSDISLVETMGLAAGYISVLVLCLFVSSERVTRLYPTPELLWLMCPIMLYWVSRVWFLARRGELHDDPVLFALRDRNSYLAGALVAAVVLAATL